MSNRARMFDTACDLLGKMEPPRIARAGISRLRDLVFGRRLVPLGQFGTGVGLNARPTALASMLDRYALTAVAMSAYVDRKRFNQVARRG